MIQFSFPGQMAAHLGSLLISELCAISASPSNGHLVRSMLPLQSIHPRQQKSVNDGHSKSLIILMFCPPDLLSCPSKPMLGCCRNLAVALWSPDAIGRHEQRDLHGSPVLPSVLGKVSFVPCVPNLVLKQCIAPTITMGVHRMHPCQTNEAMPFTAWVHAVHDLCSRDAVKAGYRHFDCAAVYGNEELMGEGLRDFIAQGSRSELYITSKVWNDKHHPDAVKCTLRFCST